MDGGREKQGLLTLRKERPGTQPALSTAGSTADARSTEDRAGR